MLSYLEERFGIHKFVFDEYILLKKNKSWWFLRESPFIAQASVLKVWITGLKAFQRIGKYIKPTTRMIQVFGHYADKAIVDIQEDDIKKMAEGEPVPCDMRMDNGYVILSSKGRMLGLGLFIDGNVRSQIHRRDIISFI